MADWGRNFWLWQPFAEARRDICPGDLLPPRFCEVQGLSLVHHNMSGRSFSAWIEF